jgi:TonB-linked SusC/RagA family outer membrane protein
MNFKRLFGYFTLIGFFVMLTLMGYSQNKVVTGKVTDSRDGAGLSGVSITIKGSKSGTQSGSNGSFQISVPANASTLTASYVGYEQQDISITGKTSVDILLASANTGLNEVVVVGYGTARRRDVTGSSVSVRAKDFNKGVQTSPDQLIQGKVAGVLVLNNSGQPGGATTVRIRGASSIRSGNQPLFVIDGVPLSGGNARPGFSGGGIGTTPAANPLNFMNPNDIASIEVLKDASATAIYGSRGSNGVVLITTKRGLSGAPAIDIAASTGISNIMKRLKVLNGDEYRAALKQYNQPAGDFGTSVDALDAILQTATTQNYNVAVGGGTDNGRYRISAGYLNQEGIVKKSGLKKYSANLTTNFKFLESKRLGLDFNVLTSHTTENIAPISNDAGFTGSLIGQALQWNPTHALIKPGTDSAWIDPAVGATTINPLAMLNAYDDNANISTILASISPSFKITNDLEYRILYSVNRSVGVRRSQVNRFLNAQGIENRGAARIANNEQTNQSLTHTLNYNKKISSAFNLNAVVGYEYLKFDSRGNEVSALDFTNQGLDYYNFLQYSAQTTRGISSYASPTTELQSYFGRAIMNYLDKYLVTATIRADGSTKFGKNNKYGYFPSVAAAWNVSNEDFLKGDDFITNLKFRVSWGQTGNQEFVSGASLDRFSFGQQSIAQTNYGNPDLKWETSTTINAGIDFSIIGDRLTGSIDYFNKKTTDVLFEQTNVQPAAGGRIWINLPGFVLNKGFEVSLNSGLVRSNNINWNLGVNASVLKNNVEGILGFYETGALSGQGISGARSQRIVSGKALNVFYLRNYQGIDKTSGQSNFEDGGNTLYYSGSPNPKLLLGLSTDVSYKKFNASINMNGNFGHYLYNNTANTVLPIGNLGTRNVAKSLINNAVKEDVSNPIAPSTRYLEKGDYIKLANATISYSFGSIGKFFKNANISLTGQNLFVITKYTGFDPEVNTDKQVDGIPSLGIEYTPYPSARTILLGINFSL